MLTHLISHVGYAVIYIVKGSAIKILIPVNHQLRLLSTFSWLKSELVVSQHLLVIFFVIKIKILLINFYLNLDENVSAIWKNI